MTATCTRKNHAGYATLMLRLLAACSKMEPRRAAQCGMWFQRWLDRNKKRSNLSIGKYDLNGKLVVTE